MFTRSKHNPVLLPDKNHPWESRKVYNPGAIYYNDKYHLFYRAVGEDWISRIGYAVSDDGEKFMRFDQPVLFPEKSFEKNGVEDPRITKPEDIFCMAYTSYDGTTARLQIATSGNLKKWTKRGPALTDWNYEKAGGVILKWREGKSQEIIPPEEVFEPLHP